MIDDLVMVMDIDPPESVRNYSQVPFEWKGFTFDPQYRKGQVLRYVSHFRNLRLVISYDKLLISGSLHKFCKGNNSGDFTWLEIRDSFEQLSVAFGENFEMAHLKKLTFACNLPIEAKTYLDQLISIKGRRQVDMVGGMNHITYGKYIKMTHYRIKIYDKKTEVQYHDGLKIKPTLRVEIELNLKAASLRKKDPILLETPSDLLCPRFVNYCRQELLTIIDHLEYTQELLPIHCTSASDVECLALMKDLDTRLMYKKMANSKTFRKKWKRYQELCNEFGIMDLRQNLMTMVEEKIEELTNLDLTLRKTG